MPIKKYQANAIKNAVEFYPLADPDIGANRASLLGFDKPSNTDEGDNYEVYNNNPDIPFFGEGGRGDQLLERSVFRDPSKKKDRFAMSKLPEEDKPTKVWPYRGYNMELIDKLTVISLAGVCSEILAYGNAEGGYADISQLRQLFNSAETELTEKEMENRVKYAISFGIAQLKLNLGVLDDLIKEMERDGSVADCCLTIEKSMNMNGFQISEYEEERKKLIDNEINMFERTFLLRSSQQKQQLLNLSGDDPFYVALAIAGLFFVWASNGGLSL